ncbi:hypothetical protein BaRGS_00016566 [Batillaria attramentaria]|uniref:Uncharacterized protein n=1 Tax=Batillaria attramentaria TaxID=370345 RepID=A0ABD0KYH9_9CAEN
MKGTRPSLRIRTQALTAVYIMLVVCDHLATATTRYLPSAPVSPWSSLPSSHISPSFLMSALSPSAEFPSFSSELNPLPLPKDFKKEQKSPQSPPSSLKTSRSSRKKPKSGSASKTLHKDLMRLSKLLPGVYANTQQYRQEVDREVPMNKRHVLLRSVYRHVHLGFLPRAFAVLVQDYSGDSLFPYRQRVHTFSVDLPHRAIRMKVWNFATKRTEKKATRNLDYFRKLRRKDLISQGSCDMFWRRLNRKTFVGITGKECLGYVRGEKRQSHAISSPETASVSRDFPLKFPPHSQVRITVSTTLTSHLLQTNEGWYRARDGKKLVEIDVPYNLIRTKSFSDERVKPRRRRMHQQAAQNDLPTKSSPPTREASVQRPSYVTKGDDDVDGFVKESHTGEDRLNEKSPTKPSDDMSDEEKKEMKDKEWVLPDFNSIIKALHSGQIVFYSVELSACSLPSQHKVKRLSFGDFVDSFESTFGGRSRDKASVRFWQTKYVQGNEGIEELTREITVQSNGRVVVRIHRKQPSSSHVAWDHVAQCKLFNAETGLGGVKLTSRPSEQVNEMATYGRLRSSLRRGRRQVRMIIDLNQCDGRTRGVKAIMGFNIRAYDFMNQGKAIEINQLITEAEHSPHKLLTGHFLQNGEVIFIKSFVPGTETDDFQHIQLLHQDATYRCALSGSDISKNHGPWGVRLFYTT